MFLVLSADLFCYLSMTFYSKFLKKAHVFDLRQCFWDLRVAFLSINIVKIVFRLGSKIAQAGTNECPRDFLISSSPSTS